MIAELLVLRFVHVVGGIFWAGSALFTALFLAPALSISGVNAGQVFAALGKRRLFVALPLVALLTIASGARLMWIMSNGFASSYTASGTGRTLMASGAAALGAFLLSLLVSRPTAVRAAQLAGTLATAPEAERGRIAERAAALRRRGGVSSMIAVALLALAAAGMSIARYV
ncbi:MAG: hypothetical protein ABI625_07145 [bacterium]